MNIDAKYHPTPEQLEGFAQGSLTPGMNVVISAHVEMCAICRKSISELEQAASEEWLRNTPDTRASSINFSAMIDVLHCRINRPDYRTENRKQQQSDNNIE